MRFEKNKIREWQQIANSNGRKEREKRGEEKRRESVVCLVVIGCCLFASCLVLQSHFVVFNMPFFAFFDLALSLEVSYFYLAPFFTF